MAESPRPSLEPRCSRKSKPAESAAPMTATGVREPPRKISGALREIGPSLILTANIVGSGELIMTTALGASAGFVALWVILVSCAVKVVVQLEFGKHAIARGETTLYAFNRLPGPRWRAASVFLLLWLAVKLIQLVQYGGSSERWRLPSISPSPSGSLRGGKKPQL